MKHPEFSESKLSPDVPTVAAEAGLRAHNVALARLGKVAKIHNGHVVELRADGSVVKSLSTVKRPATVVQQGLVLKRRAK